MAPGLTERQGGTKARYAFVYGDFRRAIDGTDSPRRPGQRVASQGGRTGGDDLLQLLDATAARPALPQDLRQLGIKQRIGQLGTDVGGTMQGARSARSNPR